jgi:hypothetical protein
MVWKREYEKQGNQDVVIDFYEIEGAEHREVLQNPEMHSIILQLVCEKKK